MTDRQSTHGHDCWGWGPKHYECEVRQVEQLAEALREAREYVVSELAAERDVFAGYEHCSNIASIEADLAKIDAAIARATGGEA